MIFVAESENARLPSCVSTRRAMPAPSLGPAAATSKLSGSSRFATYGVLNDQTNSDGSYIPMR